MLALQKTRPGAGVELRMLDAPRSALPGEVLIRIHSAGICGTDLHIAEWTPGYESMERAMPVTLGHEFSGIVETVGKGVPDGLLGQPVTVRPSTTCGRCEACLAGDEDNCTSRTGIGIGRNGAFTTLVAAPWKNCHILPAGLDMEIAALTEPMTVCAEAVETAEVRAGQRILVLGPGFIGQGIAVLARAAGADVVVVGHGDAARLAILETIGFTQLIDTEKVPLSEALKPFGVFDAIIEATGVPGLVNASLPYLKKRGIFAVVGIHPRPAEIDLTRLVRMHQQIRGSYRAPVHVWDDVIAFLTANQDMMRAMVSHRFPLPKALDGFRVAKAKTASKVVLKIGD